MRADLQTLSQNWCSFSLDGIVTPSIGIPMKGTYSVVHWEAKTINWDRALTGVLQSSSTDNS